MRGPLYDSEPGGNAPSSQPSPRTRGEGVARLRGAVTISLTFIINSVTRIRITLVDGGRRRPPIGRGRCGFAPRRSAALATTAVERREAPRARSRRSAQADRSVARAAPEAPAGGNIGWRGVATTYGASRRSTPLRGSKLVRAWQSSGASARCENGLLFTSPRARGEGTRLVNRVLTSPLLCYSELDAAGGPAVHDVPDA